MQNLDEKLKIMWVIFGVLREVELDHFSASVSWPRLYNLARLSSRSSLYIVKFLTFFQNVKFQIYPPPPWPEYPKFAIQFHTRAPKSGYICNLASQTKYARISSAWKAGNVKYVVDYNCLCSNNISKHSLSIRRTGLIYENKC